MRRPRITGRVLLAVAAIVVAAAALAALAGPGGEGEAVAPVPGRVAPSADDPGGQATARVSLPPSGRLFGFSDSTFVYTGLLEDLDQGVTPERQVADLRAAGASGARVVLSWYDLEPRPGAYNQAFVARVKAFTDRFEAVGGRVVLTLGVPPAWARAAPDTPNSAPKAEPEVDAAFARLAGFVAATWPRAAAIQTWNEPNTATFWQPYGPQPERMASLHKAAARAIREAAPETTVLLPALAGYTVDGDRALSAQTFLKRMYSAGLAPDDYDAISFHPYPPQRDGQAGPLDAGGFAQQFDDVRLGYRWRDAAARLWITETGASTTGPDALTENDQARVVAGLVRKLLTMPDVDAVFLHTLYEPRGHPRSTDQPGFGLLRARGGGPPQAKAAYCAVARMAAGRPAPPSCRAGAVAPASR